MASIHRFNK